MKNKIILGSANFNQTYGIKRNSIKTKEIKKLLNYALEKKIKLIDTSPLYHQSEKIIGKLNNSRFKIISKIPKKPKKIKKKEINKWLRQSVMSSLKIKKIRKFECLLLQDAKSLLSENGNEIYKSINSIKKNLFTKKIGISIYEFKILEKILKRFKFDVIQVPLNIFDQRLIETGWLKEFKKRKIEIHARSIFLQGILLLGYNNLPNKLKKFKYIWKNWENWLKENKLSRLQACLSFKKHHKKLDGVVLGLDSKKQLKNIFEYKKVKNFSSMSSLSVKNEQLTDPRKWT